MTCEVKLTPVQEEELAAKKDEFSEILGRVRQRSEPKRPILRRPKYDSCARIVRTSTPWVRVEIGCMKSELCLQDVQYCSSGNLARAREVRIRDLAGRERSLFNCYDVTERWGRINNLRMVQGCINTLQLLDHALQKAGR